MKATLEFNLPDEQDQFITAAKADSYKFVIYELDELLRGMIKYNMTLSAETVDKLQEVREYLHDLLIQEGIN